MRCLTLMGSVLGLAITAASGAAQSALDRPPDLNQGWVASPGSLQFDFLHRFTVSPAPDRKVSNSPTFLLGAGLPGRLMLGFNYATNSDVAERYPNEWEFLARWQPLSSDLGPLDATVEGAYNLAARSLDGAVALGRAFGPLRLLAEGRVLGSAYDTHSTRGALAGGATLRLGRWFALAGDAGKLLGSGGSKVVWGAGLQLAIPYTPHTLSLQATNTNTGTLQGSSRASGRVRYGFDFTIPLNLRRYFGRPVAAADTASRPVLPPSAGAAADAGREPGDTAADRSGAPAGAAGAVPRDSSAARSDTAVAGAGAPAGGRAEPTPAAPAAPRTVKPPVAAARTARAAIRNLAFLPARLEVAAGTTVTWTNRDAVAHSITADDGSFDSGSIAPGATWRHTFARPGRWAFHCTPHPFMHGVLVVK